MATNDRSDHHLPLSQDQARRFHRDGFLIVRNAVPNVLADRARRLIFEHSAALQAAARAAASSGETDALAKAVGRNAALAQRAEILDLFNAAPIRGLLAEMYGAPVREARGAQLANLYPHDDASITNEAGYRNRDTPHFGWVGHLDGLWNGGTATPTVESELDADEEADWQAERSTNGARKYYPDKNANIANFSALVGVPLSDQRQEGSGNLGLLKGAHKHIESFFQWQRKRGGPLGPEGPGWPRVDDSAPNRHGLVHYPPKVRQRYQRGAATTPDGRCWPRPTFAKVRPGDAVIVHWATPHSASRVMGSDPRLMAYFRTTNERPKEYIGVYPDAMCDNWLEFPGVRARLAER